MKHNYLRFLMLVVAMLVSANIMAVDFTTATGLCVVKNGGEGYTCSIVGFEGRVETSGEIVIPGELIISNHLYTVTDVVVNAFNGCDNIKKITFEHGPGKLTLGNREANGSMFGAFYDFDELEEVFLDRDLAYQSVPFEEHAYKLKRVTIGENVTFISSYLFDNTMIESVYIPSNVEKVLSSAFSNCQNLSSVTLSEGVESLGSFAFASCPRLKSIVMPNTLNKMFSSVFERSTSLESVTIGSGLQELGEFTFRGCTSLKSIDIPNTVTSILKGALSGTGLTAIAVANGVTTIENNTYTSSALAEAVIPEGITEIGTYAFNSSAQMTRVEFPSTLAVMGSYNFDDNSKIVEVYSKNPTPPVCGTGRNFESQVYQKATLYVPVGSLDLYKAATDWKSFKNIVEKDLSGVANMATEDVKCIVNGNQLNIVGADLDAEIAIYSINGDLVYKGVEKSVLMPTRGVYIVKVAAGKLFKVVL